MFFQKSRINICVIQKILVPLHPLKKKHRGVEQLVARQAHNLEVARSNPASATKQKRRGCVNFDTPSFFIRDPLFHLS